MAALRRCIAAVVGWAKARLRAFAHADRRWRWCRKPTTLRDHRVGNGEAAVAHPTVTGIVAAGRRRHNHARREGPQCCHDVRWVFDAFGPRRCFWGTDMTNSFTKASYRQRVTHFTEELDFLSEEDKDWIMGRAILTRLGWA